MSSGTPTVEVPHRRGSFHEEIVVAPGKSPANKTNPSFREIFQNTNATAVKENQTIELDDDMMLTDDNPGFTKSFSPGIRRASLTSVVIDQPIGNAQRSPTEDEDNMEAGLGIYSYQLPLDPSGKPSGKLKNKYMLADGTVVNGKGLGRGRPGFKRGPRKSGLSNEVIETGENALTFISTPSPAAQGRSTSSTKRKRADSDVVDLKSEDTFDDLSRESTPEYIAPSSTRSGRQVQKPVQATVATPITASPAAKRPTLTQTISSPLIKKHPKIKAKVYRGREQFALCEHCLRGHGPPGNVIVFCDACNKCWHQRCHDPKISKEIVADTKAEWFCSDCDRILHGKKKNKAPLKLTTPAAQASSSTPAPQPAANPIIPPSTPRYGLPLIPGMALTLDQRKHYLNSLSKERLIDIVLRSADLAPNMPIFETPYILTSQPPPPNFLMPQSQDQAQASLRSDAPPPLPLPPNVQHSPHPSAPTQTIPPVHRTHFVPVYSHPTAGIPSKPNTNPHLPVAGEDDEGYYDDFDEMALLYPKPGEGVYNLALPPESAELSIMLEGPESRTFSHWVRTPGGAGKE